MKKLMPLLLLAVTSVAGIPAWADPVKEVLELGPPRAKAFVAGDADGWTAVVAENATWAPDVSPFRIEGKNAIRAFFVDLFNRYPGSRNYFVYQPMFRAYGDNVVVVDAYFQLTLTDRGGKTVTTHNRATVTWLKIDGRWQLVQQHNAPLPTAH